MEKQLIHSTLDTPSTDCREIVEWLAQAGVTVESVEKGPADACPVCRSVDLHVAA